MDLTAKSAAQLNAMTKAQIVAAILDGTTMTETTRKPAANGDNGEQTEITRDAATGKTLGKRATTWSYYKSGEVDEITVQTYDAADKPTGGYVVKHFTDGRQPDVAAQVAYLSRVR